MSRRTFTRAELKAAAAIRPPGYLDELMAAAVDNTPQGHVFDTEHPAYVALLNRHRNDPQTRIRRAVSIEKANPKPPREADMAVRGPPLWARLHRFALSDAAKEPQKWAAFLTEFVREVPCGSCRREFRAFVKAHPPSAVDPFGWTVELHSAVNTKLQKPTLTRDQALSLWASPSEHHRATSSSATLSA